MDNREAFAESTEGKRIYYDEFGTRLQTKGIVYGDGNEDYILLLPNEYSNNDGAHMMIPTYEQWQKILKASDNPQLVITDEDRKIIKAIVGKNSRQVQESFRWAIFRRDSYTCQYCGATDRPLTIDEYLCQALGGPINEENCKTACRPCNKAKGHMTIAEWEEYREKRGLKYGK